MYIHKIIFTRFAEPGTNALLTFKSEHEDPFESMRAFELVMNRWGYQTDEGQRLDEETHGDFNIGDFLLNDESISENEEFQVMMKDEGLEFISLESVGMRVEYDTKLFS